MYRSGMGAHGYGTMVPVETRRKDGTIRRRVRVALTMPNGRRVWRTVRDEREARKALNDLIQQRELDIDPTTQTLAVYLRSWIQRRRDAKRQQLRPRTLDGYEAIIERSVIPGLGSIPLGRLSRRRIQGWLDSLDGSAGTVRNAHAVLRKALASAVGDSLPSNPAVGVELPDRRDFIGSPLSAEEAHRLLEATQGDRLHPLWRLAIVTGLRSGELRGLSRDSLDGDHLQVTAQLQRIKGEWRLGPTKAARSLQRIALDAETVSILRKHLASMAEERQPTWVYFGLMFPTPDGQPYHDREVLRQFHAACDKAGIKRRRLHDLRGTSATILRDRGVSEETRMARLGHNTQAMARHYGQASEAQDRLAVEALARAIG